jgi:hypothetical protein
VREEEMGGYFDGVCRRRRVRRVSSVRMGGDHHDRMNGSEDETQEG